MQAVALGAQRVPHFVIAGYSFGLAKPLTHGTIRHSEMNNSKTMENAALAAIQHAPNSL